MKKLIKSYEEFKHTCKIYNNGFTISDEDIYLFPMESKEYTDLLGKEVEVEYARTYRDLKNRELDLYHIVGTDKTAPWWYFSNKKGIEIE